MAETSGGLDYISSTFTLQGARDVGPAILSRCMLEMWKCGCCHSAAEHHSDLGQIHMCSACSPFCHATMACQGPQASAAHHGAHAC
jgi:hypothetical protein